MPGILEGIRIVDWTMFQVGPYASAMLADMGADVIHVEMRGRGDILRGLTSSDLPLVREGRHIHFEEHNRNKRSLTVDLNKPAGREIIYRLSKTADVFMTNLRPQAIAKQGMTYEDIQKANPRIIYALATAFGKEGPDVGMPSVDNIALARSGMMMASGFEGEPPAPVSVGTGDRTTAFMLAHGILGALLARERFGIVQEVHTSMLGACLVLHGWTVVAPLLAGKEYRRAQRPLDRRAAGDLRELLRVPVGAAVGTDGNGAERASAPRADNATTSGRASLVGGGGRARQYLYECKDGRWIAITIQRDEHWRLLCEALGDPELACDPRFATVEQRQVHSEEYAKVLTGIFATKTAEEWQAFVRQKGNQAIMFSIANSPGELVNDDQVIRNKYIMDWDHPAWGRVKWVGFPVDWSETPATLRMPAPEVGQHTEEILLELGYDWGNISRLQEEEVI